RVMTVSLDKRARIAVIVGLIAGITVLRSFEAQTGPLYLIPVAMAALWLGRWPGLATGIAASLLTRLTIEIEGSTPDPGIVAELVRLAVYGGLGYVIVLLSENRAALERTLGRREIELEELR